MYAFPKQTEAATIPISLSNASGVLNMNVVMGGGTMKATTSQNTSIQVQISITGFIPASVDGGSSSSSGSSSSASAAGSAGKAHSHTSSSKPIIKPPASSSTFPPSPPSHKLSIAAIAGIVAGIVVVVAVVVAVAVLVTKKK
jgi:hypothetical protein